MDNRESYTKTIWICWGNHRRSRVLADEFKAQYYALTSSYGRCIGYPKLFFSTLSLLLRTKPQVVFCQNPSLVLNVMLCLLKPFFKYRLVSDRHSNFKFKTYNSYSPKWVLFRLMSHLTLRHSDLVIVTNSFLKNLVECLGGNAVVLPDKLPDLSGDGVKSGFYSPSALFVCTFSGDEPYEAFISAASSFSDDFQVYITGNYGKVRNIKEFASDNVKFLGFVSESDYVTYMRAVDFVIVLTDMDYTLNCGSYEAVALGKPMILGDTSTIRSYFYKGAVYTALDLESIKSAIDECLANLHRLSQEVAELKVELERQWPIQFDNVKSRVFGNSI